MKKSYIEPQLECFQVDRCPVVMNSGSGIEPDLPGGGDNLDIPTIGEEEGEVEIEFSARRTQQNTFRQNGFESSPFK